MKQQVLVVDDEPGMIAVFKEMLSDLPIALETATSGTEAMEKLLQKRFDLIITDIRMPQMDGMELMEKALRMSPDIIIVLITAHGTIESAVAAMKKGAYDYITKPFHINEVLPRVEKALEHAALKQKLRYLQAELEQGFGFENLVGHSKSMQEVYGMIKKVADSEATVLIQGESGTGKELVARAIHINSRRKNNLFVTIDCGSLPEDLLESELFGHIRGAFTGAIRDKKGLFEEADSGTVFLDEIGEMPVRLQVKLLRVLQSGEFKPVGSAKTVYCDVRVIAATNRNLREMMHKKTFRDDLYYRLAVIQIPLPPLRERKSDLPMLVQHFINKYCKRYAMKNKTISPKAMRLLVDYSWPGNVRELENIIERAITLCEGEEVTEKDLPGEILEKHDEIGSRYYQNLFNLTYSEAKAQVLASFTSTYIQHLMEKNQGNISQAAREAEVERASFYRMMKKYNINKPK